MELNAEGRNVCVGNAFYCSVVYVEKRHFCVRWKGSVFYCVAVVLACDVYSVCFGVFAGVVATAVAVFKFAGFTAVGQGEHLVTKTDSKDWDNFGG